MGVPFGIPRRKNFLLTRQKTGQESRLQAKIPPRQLSLTILPG